MEIFGIKLDKIVNANVKVLTLPVLSILAVGFLFLISANVAVPQILNQIESLDQTKKEITILREKVDLLSQIREKILEDSDNSLLAIPSNNPTLWLLTQLNSAAEENSILINDRTVSPNSAGKGDITNTAVQLSLSGSFANIFSFVETINELAPIISVNSINFTKSGVDFTAKVSLVAFSADLPTTIPAVNQPVKNLSQAEQMLLDELAKLKAPTFTTLEARDETLRPDPFN